MSMFESEAKAYMNFFFFKSNQMLNLINKIVWLILHLGGGDCAAIDIWFICSYLIIINKFLLKTTNV